MTVVNHTINGGRDMLNTSLYGMSDPGVMNYVRESMQNLETQLNGVNHAFLDRTRQLYDTYASDEAYNRAVSVVSSMSVHTDDNALHVVTYDKLLTPSRAMQNYIAAEPRIRTHIKDYTWDGYETYVDPEPKTDEKSSSLYMESGSGISTSECNHNIYVLSKPTLQHQYKVNIQAAVSKTLKYILEED
jgi:hypothetical protein